MEWFKIVDMGTDMGMDMDMGMGMGIMRMIMLKEVFLREGKRTNRLSSSHTPFTIDNYLKGSCH